MENSIEKLYDETMEAKADVVMKAIGKRLIQKEEKEFDDLVRESRNAEVPESKHEKAYEVIKDYENRVKASKRKAAMGRLVRICALLFVVIGVSSVVFINNAEAFKYHFKNFIVEVNPEFLTLFPNDEEADGAAQDLSKGSLWYPKYIPEGFRVIDKVEWTNEVVFMFENEKGQIVKFCQGNAAGVGMGLNNEGDAQGQIKIEDKYDGYWTSNRGNTALVWIQSDQLMEIYADIDLDEIFKIANSVTYQKK